MCDGEDVASVGVIGGVDREVPSSHLEVAMAVLDRHVIETRHLDIRVRQ